MESGLRMPQTGLRGCLHDKRRDQKAHAGKLVQKSVLSLYLRSLVLLDVYFLW
jgi:hypothetical protein